MNTKLLLTSALAALAGSASAQITVNESDLLQAGYTVVNSNSSAQVAIPTVGTNKTWSFTNLNSSSKDTLKFGVASWFPGSQFFTGANLGIDNGDSTYTFLKRSSTELSILGGYEIMGGVGSANDIGFQLLKLPSTYGTNFRDTLVLPQDPFELGVDIDGGGPLPTIDSIALIVNLMTQSDVNGWGSLTTPLGTNNVIHVSNMRTNHITAKILVSNVWLDAPQAVVDSIIGNGPADTTYQCFFWTNNSTYGFPLMSYNYTAGDDSSSDVSWLSSAPAVSGTYNPLMANTLIAYPNPVSGVLVVQTPFASGTLELLNMNGQVLMSRNFSGVIRVDLKEQAQGTYMIRAISPNGEVLTKRIIRN